MIKEFDVTLRVAIDISTYDMGASGKQVIPTLQSVEKVDMITSDDQVEDVIKNYIRITTVIFNRLSNDFPDYNEAIRDAREAAEDRSVIEPEEEYDCPIHGKLGGIDECPRC